LSIWDKHKEEVALWESFG